MCVCVCVCVCLCVRAWLMAAAYHNACPLLVQSRLMAEKIMYLSLIKHYLSDAHWSQSSVMESQINGFILGNEWGIVSASYQDCVEWCWAEDISFLKSSSSWKRLARLCYPQMTWRRLHHCNVELKLKRVVGTKSNSCCDILILVSYMIMKYICWNLLEFEYVTFLCELYDVLGSNMQNLLSQRPVKRFYPY